MLKGLIFGRIEVKVLGSPGSCMLGLDDVQNFFFLLLLFFFLIGKEKMSLNSGSPKAAQDVYMEYSKGA